LTSAGPLILESREAFSVSMELSFPFVFAGTAQ